MEGEEVSFERVIKSKMDSRELFWVELGVF
jgi:hypothetical protein